MPAVVAATSGSSVSETDSQSISPLARVEALASDMKYGTRIKPSTKTPSAASVPLSAWAMNIRSLSLPKFVLVCIVLLGCTYHLGGLFITS